MDELRAAFNVFDRHQSGKVATSFLLSSLASLGYAASHQLVYSLLSATHLTALTFDDFLALMTGRVGEGSSREEVDRVFALFDEGGKGWMDEADLDRVCRLVGERMGHRERKEMFSTADTNGDGVVSKDEFYHLMTVSGDSPPQRSSQPSSLRLC
jgi:Ca2+-binding EF-hand superfamily protein